MTLEPLGTASAPEAHASRRTALLTVLPAAVALVLWLVSLPFVDPARISGWGLLTGLPVTWYLAFAIAVLGTFLGILRGPLRGWVFWAHEAVLVLVLFGTTSAVYAVPRYPWVYKHIGVVEQMQSSSILSNGYLDRTIDIYHNWPGFFVLAVAVSAVLHLSPTAVAQWSEPVFALAAGLSIAYLVGAVTRDRRRLQLTVVLFLLANWIGSNYYSPQALATVLASLFLGLVLRTMPARTGDGLVLRRLVARILRRRHVIGLADTSGQLLVRNRTLGLLTATALWTALVVTHQLTPVAVALQLGALFCLVRFRSWWLLLVWGAIEGAWVATALPVLRNKFSLFQSDALADFSWPGVALTPSLPGMRVVGATGPLLEVAAPGAALLVAAWLFWRRQELHLVALVLGFAPPFLLAVQSYGGEAVFRVYLYGLPWFSALTALGLVLLWDAAGWRRPAVVAATAVLGLVAAGASFGQELTAYVVPSDVAGSVWYETSTPPGSQAVTLTGLGWPAQATQYYPTHTSSLPSVSDYTGRLPLADGPQPALDAAADILESEGVVDGYVVLDHQQQTYARMYGIITPEQLEAFRTYLRAGAAGWQVVYDQQGVLVARHTGT